MIRRLTQPYASEDILNSLSNITKDWFTTSFSDFSPPQKFSILNIKKRKNTLISSPTGSGKTLSSFAAILDDLIRLSQDNLLKDRVYCVYISPLKALGNDIENNLLRPLAQLEKLSDKPLGIRVGVRTGDTTPYQRKKMLDKPPHILITTPESMALILTSPKFSLALENLEWLIIDEIHALADNKRGTQLSLLMERLPNNEHITRIGLSATVAPLQRVAQFLVGMNRSCDVVDVQYEKKVDIQVLSPSNNLIETDHRTLMHRQYELLHELIQQHKTTIVFTNTRSATERVVHQLRTRFPDAYTDKIETVLDESDEVGDVQTTIAAHHGSLSKDHRLRVEDRLREGSLKCVVSSTSLELGIDIGYVDLVILLGSPKSVARALQRIGRSGHKLHETAKGRVIVLGRDDLVECAVLARACLKRYIDTVHIPQKPLDVLSQELYGMIIAQKQSLSQLYNVVTQAYPYRELTLKEFMSCIKYLAGEYVALEDRHVYAKIWYDEDEQMVGRKGKMSRVLYSTNIGTIPDQTDVIVKIGSVPIGSISEPFLEGLKPGDVFVLGGDAYEFRYSRGMTAQVQAAVGKRPTVPSWFSEMLPLSKEVANKIRAFRHHIEELFNQNASSERIIEWITSYVPVGEGAASSIYAYMKQQHLYAVIPHDKRIVIEYFSDHQSKYAIFHTLYGRRINDVLSRAVAYAIGKGAGKSIEIGLSDNGFFLRYKQTVPAKRAFTSLQSERLEQIMHEALRKTEVLLRRFRHCAGRSLMVLRNYKGHRKSVGRQQVSSRILMKAVERIGKDFPIYQEAQREVLEDLMDIEGAAAVLKEIEHGSLRVEEIHTTIPSPFAFSLVLQGYSDIMRVEERQEFLRRMHHEVLAKMSLSQKKEDILDVQQSFSYEEHWSEQEETQDEQKEDQLLVKKRELYAYVEKEGVPPQHIYDTQRLLEGDRKHFSTQYIEWLQSAIQDEKFPIIIKNELSQAVEEISWK